MKTYYRRNLPHYQPHDATYHVVFRLAGSLPCAVITRLQKERLRQERRIAGLLDMKASIAETRELHAMYFHPFDAQLDTCGTGPRWLEHPQIAEVVAEARHYRDGNKYNLLAFCIMPNHVHAIVERSVAPLYSTLQSLKNRTSRQANLILQRTGKFWQAESYDHVIRCGEELQRTLWYVLNNPVKAQLVDSWDQWPWTYCKAECHSALQCTAT